MEGSRSLSRIGPKEITVSEKFIRSVKLRDRHKKCLFSFRFNATDDDIRRAYRKIVLKHHPDKRKAQGEEIRQEDDYFTCITKAYETLGEQALLIDYRGIVSCNSSIDLTGNPIKRRSYDSIDPEFDDSLPSSSDIEKRFYETFNEFFTSNARWSEKRNVPVIGKFSTSSIPS